MAVYTGVRVCVCVQCRGAAEAQRQCGRANVIRETSGDARRGFRPPASAPVTRVFPARRGILIHVCTYYHAHFCQRSPSDGFIIITCAEMCITGLSRVGVGIDCRANAVEESAMRPAPGARSKTL